MLKKECSGLVWFEFSLLQQFSFLRHGCFTRKGGESIAPFDSLNINAFPDENLKSVQENKRRIQKALGTACPLIDLEQVHGINIAIVKEMSSKTPLGQYDALITNVPDIPLAIKHADCQACLLADPVHKAIGAVHCGWRGNVHNIYKIVVDTMVLQYGTDPHNLFACIGPSLGPCHAEFREWKKDFPKEFWPFRRQENHFDLWEIGRSQLEKSGVQKNHIEVANMCTFEEKDLFFSFRRDGLTGRNATCIMLKTRVQNPGLKPRF